MEGVRHHLVGCVKYGEYFDVRAFRARAGSIVRECVGEGRSVIVVGGSNYYAQALEDLFSLYQQQGGKDTAEDFNLKWESGEVKTGNVRELREFKGKLTSLK